MLITTTLDALIVSEVKLAADLEHNYSSAQNTSVTATHHLVSQVPAVTVSQTRTWTPQSTIPCTQPLVSASPYSGPHTSNPLPCSTPYYYSPPTCYPMSTQFNPPHANSTTAPHTTHAAYSQQPPATPGPAPSRPYFPSLVPVQQTIPKLPTSEAVQAVTICEDPLQPVVAAGM